MPFMPFCSVSGSSSGMFSLSQPCELLCLFRSFFEVSFVSFIFTTSSSFLAILSASSSCFLPSSNLALATSLFCFSSLRTLTFVSFFSTIFTVVAFLAKTLSLLLARLGAFSKLRTINAASKMMISKSSMIKILEFLALKILCKKPPFFFL